LQISIFNPQGWDIVEPVAVPVSSADLVVRSSQNTTVAATVLPTDPARSRQIVQNRESASVSDFTLHFNAVVPAFGFSFYTVISTADAHQEGVAASANSEEFLASSDKTLNENFLIVRNDYLSLSFSRDTNLLSFVTDIQRNETISCSQNLMYYEAEGHLLIDFMHKKCVIPFWYGSFLFLIQFRSIYFSTPQQYPGRF
jgi:hypothetical protein